MYLNPNLLFTEKEPHFDVNLIVMGLLLFLSSKRQQPLEGAVALVLKPQLFVFLCN